jgi:hypothetical protein
MIISAVFTCDVFALILVEMYALFPRTFLLLNKVLYTRDVPKILWLITTPGRGWGFIESYFIIPKQYEFVGCYK